AAEMSEKYKDAQTRLGQAVAGVGHELAQALMPGITKSVNALADWIASIDNWEGILRTAKTAVAGLTMGLGAFIIVSKQALILEKLTAAMKALKAAMTALVATPAGWAALAVGALVTAVTWFGSASKKTIESADGVAAKLKEQRDQTNSLIDAYEKLNPNKAADEDLTRKLTAAYPQLTEKIKANVTTVEELRKLQDEETYSAAGKYTAAIAEEARDLIKRLMVFKRETVKNMSSKEIFAAYEKNYGEFLENIKKAETEANKILGNIGKEVNWGIDVGGRFFLRIKDSASKQSQEALEALNAEIDLMAAGISKRLSEINYTEAQQQADNINQLKSFLNARADLEKKDGRSRIAWLEAQRAEFQKLSKGETPKLNQSDVEQAYKAIGELISEAEKKLHAETMEKAKTHLKEFLDTQRNTEAESRKERVNQLTQFIQSQLELEDLTAAQRITRIDEWNEKLKNSEEMNYDERLALEKAHAEMRKEAVKQAAVKQAEEIKNRLGGILDSLREIETEAELERRELFRQGMQARLDQREAFFEEENQGEREKNGLRLARLQEYLEASREKLKEHYETLLEAEGISGEERASLEQAWLEESASLEKAYNKMMEDEQARHKEAMVGIKRSEVEAVADLIGSLTDLAGAFGDKNRAAAVAAKALAHAQAGINSALAFTQALASEAGPVWLKIIKASSVMAAGVAQQIKIGQTAIPSAETGGQFMIPDLTPRVDASWMRFNGGERVSVEPRSQGSGGENFNFTFVIDGQVLAKIINKQARAGELHTLKLAGNL
ncbi:MAG: hypothetical protein FWH38_05175, partial [Treponema sp.]|nr:hypothetical protein [Treponema sp.]